MRSVRRRGPDRVAAPQLTWDQYAARWTAVHGGIDPRRARASVEGWLRLGYHVAVVAARLRVRPSSVTASGLIAGLAVAVFAGRGGWWSVLGAGLVALGSVADTADGALAILTGETTRLGYVYDSVADRVSEICWLFALWLLGAPGYLVTAAGALSWIHEYTRSRANAAGMREIGAATLGERPTRAILAFLGFGLAGLAGLGSGDLPRAIATFTATAWGVLAVIGFAQLFGTVHRALAGRAWRVSGPGVPAPTPRPTRRPDPQPHPEEEFNAVDLETIAGMVATPSVYTSTAATEEPATDAAFDILSSGGPRHAAEPDA